MRWRVGEAVHESRGWGVMKDRALMRASITAVLILLLVGSVTVLMTAPSPATDNPTTVWGWGGSHWGDSGETHGNAALIGRLPVQASGLTGAMAVDGGAGHSLALKNDGTAWAWGYNTYGQLGDGTRQTCLTPKQVPDLTGVVALAGGDYHSLALKSDGTVWAWGRNNSGQLGDGTRIDRTAPVQVPGITGMVAIAGASNHSLAVRSDGTVWAWGSNFGGQLGDGTKIDRIAPVQVSGLTGVVTVAGGTRHSLALKSDGTVWAWGYNEYCQLGDGTVTERLTPVQVSGLTGVVSVDAGIWHSMALKSDGTAWGWGLNNNGQMGDGTYTTRTTAVRVTGITGVASIAAGASFNLALKSDGTVWAWGDNGGWQLGDGTGFDKHGSPAIKKKNIPVQVLGRPGGSKYLSGVLAVGAGGSFGIAINTENPYATAVSITSSPNPSSFLRGLLGQTVTFTATVSAVPPGTGTPGGTVTFWDVTDIYQHPRKPVVLGTGKLVNGKATIKVSSLRFLWGGTTPIIAVYNGSTNYCASASPRFSQSSVLR